MVIFFVELQGRRMVQLYPSGILYKVKIDIPGSSRKIKIREKGYEF